MSWIARGLGLVVFSSGATFSAQGVQHVSKWVQETFKTVSAPPS